MSVELLLSQCGFLSCLFLTGMTAFPQDWTIPRHPQSVRTFGYLLLPFPPSALPSTYFPHMNSGHDAHHLSHHWHGCMPHQRLRGLGPSPMSTVLLGIPWKDLDLVKESELCGIFNITDLIQDNSYLEISRNSRKQSPGFCSGRTNLPFCFIKNFGLLRIATPSI